MSIVSKLRLAWPPSTEVVMTTFSSGFSLDGTRPECLIQKGDEEEDTPFFHIFGLMKISFPLGALILCCLIRLIIEFLYSHRMLRGMAAAKEEGHAAPRFEPRVACLVSSLAARRLLSSSFARPPPLFCGLIRGHLRGYTLAASGSLTSSRRARPSSSPSSSSPRGVRASTSFGR